MKRIATCAAIAIRVAITVLAFVGLARIASSVPNFGRSPQMAALGCLHVLPLLGVAFLLVRPNVSSVVVGASGLVVFAAISFFGTRSWAVCGYLSGLGPRQPNYSLLYGILLSLPAVAIQVWQAVKGPRANDRGAAETIPHVQSRHALVLHPVKMIALSVYFLALFTLMFVNFSNFQSSKWSYMYQAYVWPGLCCPDCAIMPHEGFTGDYRRWGYNGEIVEETQYVNGEIHGHNFYVSSLSGASDAQWVNGVQHGLQERWNKEGRLVAVGTWRDGKRWDGQFMLAGNIVTIKNGEPWSGTFPQCKTGDDGIERDDGDAIYSDGVIIRRERWGGTNENG